MDFLYIQSLHLGMKIILLLLLLTQPPRTMLKRNSASVCLCLVTLVRVALTTRFLCICFWSCFCFCLQISLIILWKFSSMSTLLTILSRVGIKFYYMSSLHLLRWCLIFSFIPLIYWTIISSFSNIISTCISRINSTLSECIIFFIDCCTQFTIILLRLFLCLGEILIYNFTFLQYVWDALAWEELKLWKMHINTSYNNVLDQ